MMAAPDPADTRGCGAVALARHRGDLDVLGMPAVPRVRQTDTYDCGLACVTACLAWYLDDDRWRKLAYAKQRYLAYSGKTKAGCMEGIWTVELLAFMLRMIAEEGCAEGTGDGGEGDVKMTTTQTEVERGYSELAFYNTCAAGGRVGGEEEDGDEGAPAAIEVSDAFLKDIERINGLYASLAHVVAKSRYSHGDVVRELARGDTALIVLVDHRHLRCHCRVHDVPSNCRCAALPPPSPTPPAPDGFEGHYVILLGVDVDAHVYYYADPDTTCALCRTSCDVFDAARAAFGTDDDVICVRGRG